MHIQTILFDDIKNQWKKLEQQSDFETFFQAFDFHRIFLDHFGKDFDLHVLKITQEDEVIGIAPFVLRDSILELIITQPVLGRELVSDYGDILFKNGKEKDVWGAIIQYAKENNFGLKLDFVRESSASYQILTTNYVLLATEKTDVAPFLKLPKTWDEYLINLSRHDRQELRRKMKKLPSTRLVFVEPTAENLSTLFTLMRQSGENKVRFLKPEMEAFFTELVTFFHTQGSGQLVFLFQNDTPITAVVGFIFHNRWYVYNSGYRSDLKHLSPGLVLKGLLIQDAIEKGIEVFDFLRGNERYKYDLGGKDEMLYHVII